jgi:hypothetical protein
VDGHSGQVIATDFDFANVQSGSHVDAQRAD